MVVLTLFGAHIGFVSWLLKYSKGARGVPCVYAKPTCRWQKAMSHSEDTAKCALRIPDPPGSLLDDAILETNHGYPGSDVGDEPLQSGFLGHSLNECPHDAVESTVASTSPLPPVPFAPRPASCRRPTQLLSFLITAISGEVCAEHDVTERCLGALRHSVLLIQSEETTLTNPFILINSLSPSRLRIFGICVLTSPRHILRVPFK